MFSPSHSPHQPPRLLSDDKNRDASPPPPPPLSPSSQPASLQRQDSGPQGIKGILKKSRSTSVESDHSEGSTPDFTPVRQSSVTLSHPESDEETQEVDDDVDGEEEEEDDMDDEEYEEHYEEDESLTEDVKDGGGSSNHSQQREGSSCSGGSFDEMQSFSPDESFEKTSSVSEDFEELESSLDGSQDSSLKQRSLQEHITLY